MRLAIACPAGSSLALLMRRPDESRCMAVCTACWLPRRFCCTISERMLVLMTIQRSRPDAKSTGDQAIGSAEENLSGPGCGVTTLALQATIPPLFAYIRVVMTQPLTLLYRDEYLVAVHTPSGLLVHRAKLAGG